MMNEIDLTAHQAMDPVGSGKPGLAQQTQAPCCVSPTKKDQSPTGHGVGIELPGRRKGATDGSTVDACGTAQTVFCHVMYRTLLQCPETAVLPTPPNLALPQAVEAFNLILESRFPWRGEDGHYVQGETQPTDPTDAMRPPRGPLETGVVVKLCIDRQTALAPALNQSQHDVAGGKPGSRPRTDQAAVDRGPGKHRQQRAMTSSRSG